MKHDIRIKHSIDQNLSGLHLSPQQQAQLIDTITGDVKMKKKIPFTLALAAVLILVSVTALAVGTTLYDRFADRDERYGKLAEYAQNITAAPVDMDTTELGAVSARIDGAYYDGVSLSMALVIENSTHIERWEPGSEELTDDMIALDPIRPLAHTEEEASILAEYSAAVESGTPYGYVIHEVYPSDHTNANGVDLPPYSSTEGYGESGEYQAIRDYHELPEELMGLDQLELSVQLRETRGIFYFDGTESYYYTTRGDVATVTATVPRTQAQFSDYSGTVTIEGVTFTAETTLSAMGGTLTITTSDPATFAKVETSYGPDIPWTILAFDENGVEYEADGFMLIQPDTVQNHITGTGELPNELHIYLLRGDDNCDAFTFWPDPAAERENPHIILTKQN